MDFPQTNSAAPFNFRPLSSQSSGEKIVTATSSNRPKMSLPMATKTKETPVLKYVPTNLSFMNCVSII